MPEPDVAYDENSETLAKKFAEALDSAPSTNAITTNEGVDTGSARDYREAMAEQLRVLAREVRLAVQDVTALSEASSSAIAALRSANADAQQQALAFLAEIDGPGAPPAPTPANGSGTDG